jgi:uncharacterized protein with HEPN domain
MSRDRRDLDYLADIQEAIHRILAYTQGMTWDDFLDDYRTQDAIVRNIEVIGEATKNLSDALRRQYPHIPWKVMAGARDRLIHHYFGVNNEIVWHIVQEDLPALLPQIQSILDETG